MAQNFYITIPMKLRVSDMRHLNKVANIEIANLLARRPNDAGLEELSSSPFVGFKWFLGGARLQYLIEGIEVIVEVADITSEKAFPLVKTGDALHDWWLDELPQYVGARPQGGLAAMAEGFHASLIADDEDDDAYTLGIAENEDGSGASLIFMRGREAAGQGDAYCIVSSIGTHYGGVRKCEMDKSRLRLVLDDDAAEALGVNEIVNIGLSGIARDQLALLRNALADILSWGDPARRTSVDFGHG